ncbi:MAG TPA: hopanoid biosynthesis-associated protein HpnK [Candidatus Binataceae bacterium]|nr:hopanoid biosynthesis-associated protein HpnK [Candidatus Binataceae bacterium]
MKALIVNGDDFGHSAEVNAAILRTHRDGILRSASLMVAEPAAAAAAAAARDNPALDVGLHAVVCKGRGMLDPARLGGNSAGFIDNPTMAGMRYYFDKSIRAAMATEMRAQIERHLELVGYLNHIDGHLNFHVHPVIADVLVDLAVEYRIPCIRLPREPIMTTLALKRDQLPRKLIEAVIFRSLSKRTRRLLSERSIKTTDWLFGLHQSGHMTEDYVIGIIERMRDGVTELYFHPAIDLGGTPPDAAAQREVEILTSLRVRDAIDRAGIRLITYADLAKSGGNSGVTG